MENEKTMWQITLNDTQAALLCDACEEYVRLRMGQPMMFADDIATMSADYTKIEDKEKRDLVFDRYLHRKYDIEEIMRAVFRIAWGEFGMPTEKTREMRMVSDIWEAVRFARGNSRWEHPFRESDEPFPTVTELKRG